MWLGADELEGLARARGTTAAAFAVRFVRRAVDPRDGRERLALSEDRRGACALLDGCAHCTVYAARPRQCREFPFWPRALADEEAFERARAVCPGIALEVEPAVRERAFAALVELYAEVDRLVAAALPLCVLSGDCCRFEQAGHELFATALEADYAAWRHPDAPAPEAPGRCPYHVAGRCTAREGRPLGCRTYFCDRRTEDELAEAHEHFLARLRALERELGYPAAYGRFPALLAARGVGAATTTGREPARRDEEGAR